MSEELGAAKGAASDAPLRELQHQNKALQEQLRQQRALIDSLTQQGLPTQTRRITVPENGEIKEDFMLGFGSTPKP